MYTSICGSLLSNKRYTIEVGMSLQDIPSQPILTRQNAYVQQYCGVCASLIPLFLTYETKICSPNCFNDIYHDKQILYNIGFYRDNYNLCKKLLYGILPEYLANMILEYHDYNLSKYSNIKFTTAY